MRSRTNPVARGSTARGTLEYLRMAHGAAAVERVLARLEKEQRRQVLETATMEDMPYESVLALWRAADLVLGARHPEWVEAAGAYACDGLGQRLYPQLWRKGSPLEFVTRSVKVFRLYYAPGEMLPVEAQPGYAVLRLVGFHGLDPLFCRRQSGGLARALELASGRHVAVRHVRCEHDGDVYCEWQLRWAQDPPAPPRPARALRIHQHS